MNTQQRIECILEFLDYLDENTEIELMELISDYDFYHSVDNEYVLNSYKDYLDYKE